MKKVISPLLLPEKFFPDYARRFLHASFLVSLALLTGCHSEKANVSIPHRPIRPPAAISHPLMESDGELAHWKPFPDEFMKGPASNPQEVALTFDAGSDARATTQILKELTARHIRCTFFLTGTFCRKFPKESRAIANAQMEIGNHSYSHPMFTHLDAAEVHREMTLSEQEITKVCGRGTKPLFRFPYGDSNGRVCRLLNQEGYQPIRWTLDSLDALGKPKSADYVAKRIISKIKPGAIVLMHVSCKGSAMALPRIFAYLDKLGTRVVPVSELLLSSLHEKATAHIAPRRSDPRPSTHAGTHPTRGGWNRLHASSENRSLGSRRS